MKSVAFLGRRASLVWVGLVALVLLAATMLSACGGGGLAEGGHPASWGTQVTVGVATSSLGLSARGARPSLAAPPLQVLPPGITHFVVHLGVYATKTDLVTPQTVTWDGSTDPVSVTFTNVPQGSMQAYVEARDAYDRTLAQSLTDIVVTSGQAMAYDVSPSPVLPALVAAVEDPQSCSLHAYTIDGSGKPTEAANPLTFTLAATSPNLMVAEDPLHRLLVAASYSAATTGATGSIRVLQVDAVTAELTQITQASQVNLVGLKAMAVVVDAASHTSALLTVQDSGRVSAYTLDGNGQLTLNATTALLPGFTGLPGQQQSVLFGSCTAVNGLCFVGYAQGVGTTVTGCHLVQLTWSPAAGPAVGPQVTTPLPGKPALNPAAGNAVYLGFKGFAASIGAYPLPSLSPALSVPGSVSMPAGGVADLAFSDDGTLAFYCGNGQIFTASVSSAGDLLALPNPPPSQGTTIASMVQSIGHPQLLTSEKIGTSGPWELKLYDYVTGANAGALPSAVSPIPIAGTSATTTGVWLQMVH